MKRNELVSFIEKWINEGVITSEQGERMLSSAETRIEERGFLLRLLPLFAAILLGLSMLTFIASNWGGMTDEAKLAVIFIFVPAFYAAGAILYRKGKHSWGIAGIFLGVVSFGVGMLLISDMFQYMAYDASLFFFWSLFALLFACLYRNMLLIVLAALLTIAGQIYSASAFESVHTGILLVSTVCFIYIVQKEKRWVYSFIFALLTIIQWCVLLPFSFHAPGGVWAQLVQYTVPFIVLMIMVFMGEKAKEDYITLFKKAALFALYLYYVYNIILPEAIVANHVKPAVITIYALLLLLAFTLSYSWKKQTGTIFSIYEWILFVPVLFLQNETAADWAALLIVMCYPVGLLLEGYKYVQKQKIAAGSRLFIVSIFAVYFQFGFTYMSKSFFFLIGAVLIIVLYIFLSKKEKQVLQHGEEQKK